MRAPSWTEKVFELTDGIGPDKIAEKNLKIKGTTDSRRIDRPGIIRMLRNKEVQRMWDQVATHEFPMSDAEKAFQVSANQQCGKILLYPHRH